MIPQGYCIVSQHEKQDCADAVAAVMPANCEAQVTVVRRPHMDLSTLRNYFAVIILCKAAKPYLVEWAMGAEQMYYHLNPPQEKGDIFWQKILE